MNQYMPVALLLGVAVGMGAVMVLLSQAFGPRRPGAVKDSPFECGMEPVGSARTRFPVRYYLIALVFVVFDLEAVFIYPWAASYLTLKDSMGAFVFWEMLVFVGILLVGYVYLWRRGALDWE